MSKLKYNPLYLKSIKLLENYRCFKKNYTILLDNVTLLVGDQGSGKSTLLELLAQHDPKLELELTDEAKKGANTFYFDSEKMNPRIKDPLMYSNFDGTNKGIGVGAAIASRFSSHGETLVNFTVNALKKAKNCVVFLDEPESSLSIKNQFKLIEEINNAAKRNCQLVIATHCLPLIQCQKYVLSLEHNKWMDAKQFIEEQKSKDT